MDGPLNGMWHKCVYSPSWTFSTLERYGVAQNTSIISVSRVLKAPIAATPQPVLAPCPLVKLNCLFMETPYNFQTIILNCYWIYFLWRDNWSLRALYKKISQQLLSRTSTVVCMLLKSVNQKAILSSPKKFLSRGEFTGHGLIVFFILNSGFN